MNQFIPQLKRRMEARARHAYTPEDQFSNVAGLWIRAEDHDFGSITVPNPLLSSAGQASSFTSLQSPPGTDFAQYRPVVRPAGGRVEINFDPSVPFAGRGPHLISSSAKSAYKWMHAAAGITCFGVVRWNDNNGSNVYPILNTGGFYGSETGLTVSVQSGRVQVTVGNGSGTYLVQAYTDVLAPNLPYLVEFWFSQKAGYCLRINGDVPTAGTSSPSNGVVTGTASSGNPNYFLTLGGLFTDPFPFGVINYYFSGGMRELLVLPGVMSGEDIQLTREFFSEEHSIKLARGFPPYKPIPTANPRIAIGDIDGVVGEPIGEHEE